MKTYSHKKAPGEATKSLPSNSTFFYSKVNINTPADVLEHKGDSTEHAIRNTNNDHQFFPHVQRKCAHCENEEQLQRKESTSHPTEASSETNSYIGSLSSKGSSLSESSRNFFEPKFTRAPSQLKIHKNSNSDTSPQ